MHHALQNFLFTMLFLALTPTGVVAVVELAPPGDPPVLIEEVYQQQGISYLPIDEVEKILGLSGKWDSTEHVYRLNLRDGKATISPGSNYLRFGERFIPMEHKPRFIDGKLRVSEGFVTTQLPLVLGYPLYYRNLNPQTADAPLKEATLEGFFSFLSRKDSSPDRPRMRALAIDPGHGGNDPGTLNASGVKEKDMTLAMAGRLARLTKMKLGIPVYLSRDDDYAPTAEDRAKPAQRADVDVFLIFHAQAAFDARTHGIDLFVRPDERSEKMGGDDLSESLKLARELRSALLRAGFDVNEVHSAPLVPLGRGDLPTVLIELGYLTNPKDAITLTTPEERDKMVAALYTGLDTYIHTTSESP